MNPNDSRLFSISVNICYKVPFEFDFELLVKVEADIVDVCYYFATAL